DGSVAGDPLAGKILHHLADLHDVAFVDGQGHAHLVPQHHRHLGEGGVARPLPQAVDGAVDGRHPGAHRRHHIGHGETVVVVGVKVEAHPGVAGDHVGEAGVHLVGGHHPQGIRQHHMADADVADPVHQAVDVVAAVPVAVGPVLQVDIDGKPPGQGMGHRQVDALDVLVEGHAQLFAAVFLAALGEQVDDPPAGVDDPVDTAFMVDEAEHFDAAVEALVPGPGVDGGHRALLTLGHAGGGHL